MFCYNKLLWSIILLLITVGWTRISWSGQTTLTPSLTLREEYNDNIVMSIRNRQDDYITLISPNIRSDYKTERLNTSLNLGVTQWLYANETNLDTLDQKYSLNGSYRLTPRLGINASGAYTMDTSLEQELLESGYSPIRTDRNIAAGSAGFSYELIERTVVDATYSFTRADYDFRSYPDTTIHRGFMNIAHQFKNMATSALLRAGYTHYDYETGDSNNYQGMLGFRHRFSETFDVTALGGIHYIESEHRFQTFELLFDFPFFRLVPTETTQKQSKLGWVADVNFTKRFERSNIGLSFGRDVINTVFGETVERMRTSINLGHRLTERLRASFSSGYYKTKSPGGGRRGINYESYSIGPTLRYQVTKYISSEMRYHYTNVTNKEIDAGTHRNMAALLINFTWPQ